MHGLNLRKDRISCRRGILKVVVAGVTASGQWKVGWWWWWWGVEKWGVVGGGSGGKVLVVLLVVWWCGGVAGGGQWKVKICC